MNRKAAIKGALVGSLFFLALGGWLLHLRIHPAAKNPSNIIPFVSGIIGVFCLPLMFYFRPTITLAYLVNGFSAIIGTITMAHFSLITFKDPFTPVNILLKTTLADIAILLGKFFMGKAIFDLEFLKSETDTLPRGRFFRYPNMGWWGAHFFGLALVYALGKIFWK